MVDQGHQSIDASPAVATDGDQDGSGISLTTAVGGGSLTAVYVWDGSPNDNGQGNPDAGDSSMGFSFSMPAGGATVTVGHSVSDDTTTKNDTLRVSQLHIQQWWNTISWLSAVTRWN